MLLALVLFVGLLFALPNLFGDYKAVQIAARDGVLDESVEFTVKQALTEVGLGDTEIRKDDGRLLALFEADEDQLKAREAIENGWRRVAISSR